MDKPKLLKERLGKGAIIQISQALSAVVDDFPAQQFIIDANAGLDKLELKQRVDYLIVILGNYLPDNFANTSLILIALKNHWLSLQADEDSYEFSAWPLVDYVAIYGLEQPAVALKVLCTLTPLFSAEFAIRPFIEQHFELTYIQLLKWCNNPDEHIRRLASEGIRPRLPWGKQLKQFCDDPSAIFPILELLKDDESLYVRRSVANNLNDISKDHPDKVVALCQQWLDGATVERQWVVRHALRSLIKKGHPAVFPLLGYADNPEVEIITFELTGTTLQFGQEVGLSACLLSTSNKPQKWVVDYKIHYVKANGRTTTKVFKWKNIELQPHQKISLAKMHPFKLISTRQYYAGTHTIELMINGQSYASEKFYLNI